MKKLYKYIVFVIGILAFSACTDDVEFPSVAEEGTDVTLSLNLKPEISKEIVNSRATAEENKLYDLHIYVFEPTRVVNGIQTGGTLIGYEQLDFGDDGMIHLNEPNTYSVNVRTKTGTSYIYALANINNNIGSTYSLSPQDNTLLNVTTGATSSMSDEAIRTAVTASNLDLTTFLDINFNRRFGSENELFSPDPDGKFIMSGYLNDGNQVTIRKEGQTVSIADENEATITQPIIKLYRILAKNTFTITSFNGTGKKGTFTPKYYRLCNVPKTGVLIPKSGISNPAAYVSNNFTTAQVESSYRWNFEGNTTITFYYPENLRAAKVSNITQWNDREKNSWDKTNNTKTFTYAHDNASYIEIHGDFIDTTGKITANVSYTIHFGDFSKSKADNNDYSDYNVIRNHEYTYEVTVNGVDDIKVEAQTTTQDNPYAEGVIVNAEAGMHYSVDAHYEARVMTFTKSSFEDLQEVQMGYFLSINTPFGNTKEPVYVKSYTDNSQIKYGVFNASNERLCNDVSNITQEDLNRIFEREADYTWMKFVRNTTGNRINNNNAISSYVCKYPGDQWTKKYHSASTAQNKPDQPWLNVFELLAELYKESTYNQENNTEVYYTCFVDENYYANKSWTAYVDQTPRTMLIANDLDISSDGKSIYAEVAYSISQRSITTFYRTDYKPDNTNLVKAFGTEIIDEEKDFESPINSQGEFSHPNGKDRDWDAWSTSNATFTSNYKNWYNDYSTATTTRGIQPLYTSAAKGCLSRNRDLNGDGDVDTEEVRWYLASVGQYRGLFIGQNALEDEDAYLVKASELNEINQAYLDRNRGSGWGSEGDYGHSYRSRYHFYTSTAYQGSGKATFWPEEGLTNNELNGSWSKAELVRCVRTLESNGDGRKDPERYYTYASNTFNLAGIVATRNRTDDPLPIHNEIQKANNLYSSFIVASADMNQQYLTKNITGREADYCTDNYSEGGHRWRTPNQKEYALMSSHVSNLGTNQGIRTKFSGSYDDVDPENGWAWHNTVGFWGQGDVINVGSNESTKNVSVNIRCVRDGQ